MNLRELSDAIGSGRLSPVHHVEEVIERLRADKCNAIVHLDPDDAMVQARRLADELADGRRRGPLHGVAIVVKDIIDVRGAPTRCGSNVMRDAPAAVADAVAVARLREAGAVIVAKSHTHEFAYGPTGDTAAEGTARNPHDPNRITGGSSSGSAAAVAAGYVPLGLGTDTGCSIRTPAALCGAVGLKPRFALVPTTGVFPLSETCDHIGLVGGDAHAVRAGYVALTGEQPAARDRTLVIGRPTDPYWRVADEAIADAVDEAARRLAAAGHRVEEVDLPGIDDLAATYRPIVGGEAYTTHAGWLAQRPQDYQPITAERLMASADQPATSYVDAQRTRRRIAASLTEHLTGVDVLLTPTTPLRATPIGQSVVDGREVRAALLSLTLPFNLTGWPAVSTPVREPNGGLPAGVQLVGVGLPGAGSHGAGSHPVGEHELLTLVEMLWQPAH